MILDNGSLLLAFAITDFGACYYPMPLGPLNENSSLSPSFSFFLLTGDLSKQENEIREQNHYQMMNNFNFSLSLSLFFL